LGTNNPAGGPINVQKNAGATVRQAFLFAASTGFTGYTPTNTDVTLNGDAVAWNPAETLNNSIGSVNVEADVTSVVKPIVDAASSGLVPFTVAEGAETSNIDGEILAVIFDDPNNVPANKTIALMYGAQATGGDTFSINLAKPLNLSTPGLGMVMGLGDSYGYQPAGQYSTIQVNGQMLTSSAGGQDDCDQKYQTVPDWGACGNGSLLTVGGIGDSPTNPPDPTATDTTCANPPAPRCDDELYSLLPFLHQGDTTITVDTQNPSANDNIFFASLELTPLSAKVSTGGGINYVAMGDSFSSGQGLGVYDSTSANDKCDRSLLAYPYQLLDDSSLGIGTLNFVACNGATRQDAWLGQNGELTQFAALSSPSANLVTLSLGGDDVDFSTGVQHCVVGGDKSLIADYLDQPVVQGSDDCQNLPVSDPTTGKRETLNQLETKLINNLGADSGSCPTLSGPEVCSPSLHAIYEGIAQDSAPGVKIYVLLYPHLFKNNPEPRGCTIKGPAGLNFLRLNITTSKANMIFVNSEVDKLDSKIISEVALAKKSGVDVVTVDPRPAFDDSAAGASPGGHGVCSAVPWINGFVTGGGSFHPNVTGHSEFATLLESAIGSS